MIAVVADVQTALLLWHCSSAFGGLWEDAYSEVVTLPVIPMIRMQLPLFPLIKVGVVEAGATGILSQDCR